MQKLANELGLDIVVSHLPPGTSKWNKIEHRLFSFISQNWRADAEIAALNIKRAEFHGDWNYTISPNTYPPNAAFIS